MKALKKAFFCILLACTFFVPAFAVKTQETATAATTPTGYTEAGDVDYDDFKSGNYIANWGAREEDCVFLTTYAQDFYAGSYVYESLSQVKGGTGKSDAPSSALYKSLQTLMSSKQHYQTSYEATKNLFRYTDCLQGNSSKISSFYSGQMLSGTWGTGWNREHTWPNSKGDKAGNGENDIMMLRPTSSSENSSRGNDAYGEAGGYYDPNELGQKLRGDCARIVLYVYVRWGCTNTGSSYNPTDIFGQKGVIESLTLLLRWMQEDPVDTWEMGRNDAVQSITGTRNVFVDYPEYAWLLFGQDIPENMTTPSGIAKGGATDSSSNSSSSSSSNSSFEDSSTDSSVDSSDNSSSDVTPPSGETATYTYDFTSNPFSGNGTKALNGVNWTLTGDGGYWGFDGQNGKGAQFGSKNNPYKTMTFTSADFEDVTKIQLNTCGAAQIAGTCAVYVGGVLVETITLTSSDTDYTIDVSGLSGEIQLKYTQTSSRALYIKSISVTCVESEVPPADSSVEESSSIEDSSEEISSSIEESSSVADSSEETSSSVEESVCEHEYGRWYVIKKPTETEEGEQQRFCQLCGELQVESIPVLALESSSVEESSSVADSSEATSSFEEESSLTESSEVEESSEEISASVEESSSVENSNEESSVEAESSLAESSGSTQGNPGGVMGCSSSVGASMGGVFVLLTACSFVYKRKKKE